MPKFLIEVPHEEDTLACAKAVHVFLSTGSHFLSQADWGCLDDCHSAWLIVEVETRDEARGIVPQAFRAGARVVQLNRFSLEHIERLLARLGKRQDSKPS